ncbi:hypothetical protein [Amycolatopsis sp. NPDC059657]|uniref:hypothetical protein n=1 Tax=Amycolatopsis sp. NPDC059657 TaxID=3346899 RepID=UPI00366A8D33
MEKEEHIAVLHSRRERVKAIEHALDSARTLEETLRVVKETLNTQLDSERAGRLADIRAADADGVPRIRIAREVGLSRGQLYNLIDDQKPAT